MGEKQPPPSSQRSPFPPTWVILHVLLQRRHGQGLLSQAVIQPCHHLGDLGVSCPEITNLRGEGEEGGDRSSCPEITNLEGEGGHGRDGSRSGPLGYVCPSSGVGATSVAREGEGACLGLKPLSIQAPCSSSAAGIPPTCWNCAMARTVSLTSAYNTARSHLLQGQCISSTINHRVQGVGVGNGWVDTNLEL